MTASSRGAAKVPLFHPDLAIGRFFPPVFVGPRLVRLINRKQQTGGEAPPDIIVEDLVIPGPDGVPSVRARSYRPRTLRTTAPALVWVHGGGTVLGSHLQDEASNIAFARTLGISVLSVGYRLAPTHPAPAALEDVLAAFRWLAEHADERGVDPQRIAIGGASAGGGLAAGTTLLAHDRGGPQPAFQLLVYPMLDDRTVTRPGPTPPGVRVWTPRSNRFGWSSYLGAEPGGPDVSVYAAPARRDDLSGLPPAWIGVGTLDLFHDEDVRYAERLRAAGVPCELEIVEGAFHGFDALFRRSGVTKRFWSAQSAALGAALAP
ncbi:alpha/beta hydrolase [Rathayibacter tanaceti]|uniref:Alpha/beta hydrolase fold domain-containing protein n=2 Tax=Rathayibacter tanaceti TaxID=1671680 RepID=A0A166HMR9_9MICO|nr:alpha/beta hydrolase [Rathayibacter tanaceti]KZX20881.1 Carboxylesterase NlhH [Rathayibacter tanaceti]QHC54299.1 alpha/beta hydrolase fold domain-containing protein [Rathayibacter tanaceti]TCO37978.1 acetyl esterase/lipase [Rathayibacter tanaceti]